MYRPKPYAVDDVPTLHAFIRGRAFATIAAIVDGGVALAYAPVVLDASGALGTVRFHLARANPLASVPDGTALTLSFNGPDAYVSPDWYVSQGLVPTWNYVAIEGHGKARHMSDVDLRALLADLSAAEEAKLTPKEPWMMDKVPDDRRDALMRAIVGFAVEIETLEGKYKLSQDKSAADAAGVIAGLEGRKDGRAAHIAFAMRRTRE